MRLNKPICIECGKRNSMYLLHMIICFDCYQTLGGNLLKVSRGKVTR